MKLQIIGYLATDSDGFQYLHKKLPTKKLIHTKEIKNNGLIIRKEQGEWKIKGSFKKELGIAKILIGKKAIEHTWKDSPIKFNITMEKAND